MTQPKETIEPQDALPHQHRRARRPSGAGRLRRAREGRMVAGVLAGISDFLDVRPLWLRLFFVVGVPLTGGLLLLVYVLLWLLLPGPARKD